MRHLFILFALFFVSLWAAGQEPGSTLIRKCNDFTVTGNGSSENWNKTEWLTLSGRGTDDPSYETAVKVLYSKTGIYFLYKCGDHKLVSTMNADNMDLWNEDVVELFLWTDENFPVYFE